MANGRTVPLGRQVKKWSKLTVMFPGLGQQQSTCYQKVIITSFCLHSALSLVVTSLIIYCHILMLPLPEMLEERPCLFVDSSLLK